MTATIGVGMLGYQFMGRAHAHAYRTLAAMLDDVPLTPELVAVAGRDTEAVGAFARKHGVGEAVGDWRALVEDDRIGLFDNSGPNALHAEPTIAAARAGKHVVCEKPLGRDAAESYETWQAVEATGVVALCGFNHRFVPAIRLARDLIADGAVGEIRHFRIAYLQDWGAAADDAAWRFDPEAAGSGALGDIASHAVDLARFLAGEIESVTALVETFQPGRKVDDAVAATVRFASGAIGTLEATRFATGRRNALRWEVNGSAGSIAFDLERLNELEVSEGGRSFRRIVVSDPEHPLAGGWWPPGHLLGWEHTFVFELAHVLRVIGGEGSIAPLGATLQDGYRAAEVCDALLRSSRSGAAERLVYRG